MLYCMRSMLPPNLIACAPRRCKFLMRLVRVEVNSVTLSEPGPPPGTEMPARTQAADAASRNEAKRNVFEQRISTSAVITPLTVALLAKSNATAADDLSG